MGDMKGQHMKAEHAESEHTGTPKFPDPATPEATAALVSRGGTGSYFPLMFSLPAH